MHRFATNVIIKRLISGAFFLSFYYSIRELLGCIILLPMSLERGISQARSLSLFIKAFVNYWDASFCYQCHYQEAYIRRVLSLSLLQLTRTTGMRRFTTHYFIIKWHISGTFSLSFYYSIHEPLGCIILLPKSL